MATTTVVGEVFAANSAVVPVGTATGNSNTFIFAPTKGSSLLLIVDNTGTVATATVTVQPGDNPPAFQAGAGTFTAVVGTTAPHRAYILLESARFTQDDGTILVTFAGFSSGTVEAFEMPRGY